MKTKLAVGLFVFIALIGALFIHIFVWPFTTSRPNFTDVEKTFLELPVPSNWRLIEITENRGIAGRACPIEGSGCFSKRVLYKTSENTVAKDIIDFMNSSGCGPVTTLDNSKRPEKSMTYYCRLPNGVKLGSDFRIESREATLILYTY